MTVDEALRRVRDPHEVLQLTDVELTEAAVTLALEVEQLRAENGRLRVWGEAEYQHGYTDGQSEVGEG